MKPSKTSSSANSQPASNLSMAGKTAEEYERARTGGMLTKQQFLTHLRKNGQLPPDTNWQLAS
ncbi:hypothetical protein [Hymenobacter cellulosilyticus]|uniref:Uncharacterized protein n=1 Tax=Hymenobacter cellulosilyticus TaxID=2932248 RepID=A0A8T9Q6K1_9BACT|nr:hypothetical protein [Hymenobacter cellulosilyticus]UOQ73187.1 hypothetical protein MUN79_04240 [Hymenobacter cellulosilyticus]